MSGLINCSSILKVTKFITWSSSRTLISKVFLKWQAGDEPPIWKSSRKSPGDMVTAWWWRGSTQCPSGSNICLEKWEGRRTNVSFAGMLASKVLPHLLTEYFYLSVHDYILLSHKSFRSDAMYKRNLLTSNEWISRLQATPWIFLLFFHYRHLELKGCLDSSYLSLDSDSSLEGHLSQKVCHLLCDQVGDSTA